MEIYHSKSGWRLGQTSPDKQPRCSKCCFFLYSFILHSLFSFTRRLLPVLCRVWYTCLLFFKNWFIYSAMYTNDTRTAHHWGLSAAPFRKGGSANHLPPSSPSSPLSFSTKAINLLFALPAACHLKNLRIRHPSTHTEKHFRRSAGSSLVLRDGCGCGWVDTDGWRDGEYIHLPSLSSFISKNNTTLCPHSGSCPSGSKRSSTISPQGCWIHSRQHCCTHHCDCERVSIFLFLYIQKQKVLVNPNRM